MSCIMSVITSCCNTWKFLTSSKYLSWFAHIHSHLHAIYMLAHLLNQEILWWPGQKCWTSQIASSLLAVISPASHDWLCCLPYHHCFDGDIFLSCLCNIDIHSKTCKNDIHDNLRKEDSSLCDTNPLGVWQHWFPQLNSGCLAQKQPVNQKVKCLYHLICQTHGW